MTDPATRSQGGWAALRLTGAALLLVAVLIAAVVGAVRVWSSVSGVQLTWHAYLAMGLGAGLTIALAVGLMRLSFISHRRGVDDIHTKSE